MTRCKLLRRNCYGNPQYRVGLLNKKYSIRNKKGVNCLFINFIPGQEQKRCASLKGGLLTRAKTNHLAFSKNYNPAGRSMDHGLSTMDYWLPLKPTPLSDPGNSCHSCNSPGSCYKNKKSPGKTGGYSFIRIYSI